MSVSENFPVFGEFFTPELINIPPGAQGFTTPGPEGEEYTPFKFPEVTTYTPEETVPSTQSIVFPGLYLFIYTIVSFVFLGLYPFIYTTVSFFFLGLHPFIYITVSIVFIYLF